MTPTSLRPSNPRRRLRIPRAFALTLALLLGSALDASAHPAPFTYLDLKISREAIEGTLLLHDFDVAHDLGIDPPERLTEPGFVDARAASIADLVRPRLTLVADGRALPGQWSGIEAVPDRQSVRLHVRYALTRPLGTLALSTLMFPYDPIHQTFLNVYEGESLTQAILDRGRTQFLYYAGTRQGALAVVRRIAPTGVRHIFGADHLVFLFGLLLLGGTMPRLTLVVTAFTIANTAALLLAVWNLVSPPARYIEPAIALSIVYVGADNLLVNAQRDGRDMRVWIALAFGFIHGFGYAAVLRGMDLPGRALTWSVVAFNAGVEAGQLIVVLLLGSLLVALGKRSDGARRLLTTAGSIAVVAVGAFWFVQRVFFPT